MRARCGSGPQRCPGAGSQRRLREPLAASRYQRKDAYHQRAKSEGFRSRAVYKLAEIQEKHRLLRKGQRVVDLGCWPGGWLQRAAADVGPSGRVVGIDRAPMEPLLALPHVVALEGDLGDPETAKRLVEALGGCADVVLSDAAPKLTGVRDRDRALEEGLLCAVEALLPEVLRCGGDLLLKILEGPEAQAVDRRIRRLFASAKTVKVQATRKGSSERYLLARKFRAGPGASPPAPPG